MNIRERAKIMSYSCFGELNSEEDLAIRERFWTGTLEAAERETNESPKTKEHIKEELAILFETLHLMKQVDLTTMEEKEKVQWQANMVGLKVDITALEGKLTEGKRV